MTIPHAAACSNLTTLMSYDIKVPLPEGLRSVSNPYAPSAAPVVRFPADRIARAAVRMSKPKADPSTRVGDKTFDPAGHKMEEMHKLHRISASRVADVVDRLYRETMLLRNQRRQQVEADIAIPLVERTLIDRATLGDSLQRLYVRPMEAMARTREKTEKEEHTIKPVAERSSPVRSPSPRKAAGALHPEAAALVQRLVGNATEKHEKVQQALLAQYMERTGPQTKKMPSKTIAECSRRLYVVKS